MLQPISKPLSDEQIPQYIDNETNRFVVRVVVPLFDLFENYSTFRDSTLPTFLFETNKRTPNRFAGYEVNNTHIAVVGYDTKPATPGINCSGSVILEVSSVLTKLPTRAEFLARKRQIQALEVENTVVRAAMDTAVNAFVGPDCLVEYSAFVWDSADRVINNLNTVAHEGRIQFKASPESFFGGKESKAYESPILENPTWLELCKHANDMMIATNDHHHCYLEGIAVEWTDDNGLSIASFDMGS